MKTTLTSAEKKALLDVIVTRMRHDLGLKCDCPLHRLSKEERAARIDAAIDATNAQIRDGKLPKDSEGK